MKYEEKCIIEEKVRQLNKDVAEMDIADQMGIIMHVTALMEQMPDRGKKTIMKALNDRYGR